MIQIIQAIVGLGLLNVWLLRANTETAYRGGESKNLKEEFTAYGLPAWSYYLIGFLKVTSALALIVGFWVTNIIAPASLVILFLMLGAVSMHFKIDDELIKMMPATIMLILSTILVISHY